MKKYKLVFLLFFLPVFIFGSKNKKYYITNVDIIGQLIEDGSVDVTENRTYKFKGSFKYAFQKLKKSEGIRYDNISVSEGQSYYYLSSQKDLGSYQIIESDDHIEIRWNFKAKNESRTFTLKYIIYDLIERYNDAATIYHKFVGNDWRRSQENVTITLLPPVNISQYDLQAWLHGPLWAEYKITPEGIVEAWCDNLPKKTFFEIRAIYPQNLFFKVPISPNSVKSQIIVEETKGVEIANQKRQNAIIKEREKVERWEIGKWVVIIFCMTFIFGWIYLYGQFGKRPQVPYKIGISSDIPEPIAPALLQYLLANREIYGNSLIATIFDLSRKNIMDIKRDKVEKKSFFGKIKTEDEYIWEIDRDVWDSNRSTLLKYENQLLEFIFNKLANRNNTITVKEIKKSTKAFTKFFNEWKKLVKSTAEDKQWWDKNSIKGMKYSFFLTGCIGICNIPFIFLFGPWAIISGVTTILILLLSFAIAHRTLEGEILYKKWIGLKKYLTKGHFNKLDIEDSINNISDYLLYSTVLGIKSKMVEQMISNIPDKEINNIFHWYGDGYISHDGFANSFNTMISATSSTMSTASGSGGGASAGGGGGSGGGGGGAG